MVVIIQLNVFLPNPASEFSLVSNIPGHELSLHILFKNGLSKWLTLCKYFTDLKHNVKYAKLWLSLKDNTKNGNEPKQSSALNITCKLCAILKCSYIGQLPQSIWLTKQCQNSQKTSWMWRCRRTNTVCRGTCALYWLKVALRRFR